ncbi:P-loop containing nucleoside triphosphate hydrolase protein [Xylaria arbuscula]|nr:P-loop containing nucleoside triphosphate hydrolase protein [Xylaria arbuscula]
MGKSWLLDSLPILSKVLLYAPFVNHYRNSSPTHTDMSLATRLELQRMAIYSTDFKYLSTHNRDVLTNRQQKEYDTRHARLTGFLDDFNPEMTVARDPSSLFRGKRIGGPLGLIHIKACPMTDGNTYDAIRQLSVRVAQNITQLYQDRLEYLTERGRENEMPTKKDFTDNMIHTMAQYPARPNQDKAWRTLSRSCSFPLVGLLTRDQTIDSDKLLTEAIKDVATPITDRLHPDRRDRLQINEINDHLRKSPFYPYRAQLEQESPKINFIEELINRLLVTKDRPVGDEQVKERHGDPPADGTNNHHLLVFSEMAISAFLCFMILWTRFEAEIRDKKIFILYVHSGVPAAVRHVYKGYLQEDCQPGDPIKILISTSNLFGEGYNLQRVNTCVLTEIPSTYEIQRQCFGRVDRTGQSMRTWLYQLYDERNPTEKIRYRRNKNKRELAMREAQGDDVQEQPEEDLIDELDPNRRA